MHGIHTMENSLIMEIGDCTPDDKEIIAKAILTAIGDEITENLAGDKGYEAVLQLFSSLAGRDDTQYSYLNTRVARSREGKPMGLCISYDGKDLKKLRKPFFKEANSRLGWNLTDEEIDSIPGETDDNEFYLDTLTTLPEYRGKGVASALIKDALEKSRRAGKPLGLLCDKTNEKARGLYERIGFSILGMRPFAGHDMYHLQLFS